MTSTSEKRTRNFGGLGGVMGGRERDAEDEFENAVDATMGERLRAEGPGPGWTGAWFGVAPASAKLGTRLWGSLANVDWRHDNGDTAGYSFRAAGDLIASIVGSGDYMDWYCSAPDGVVDPEVAALLEAKGWHAIPTEKT